MQLEKHLFANVLFGNNRVNKYNVTWETKGGAGSRPSKLFPTSARVPALNKGGMQR